MARFYGFVNSRNGNVIHRLGHQSINVGAATHGACIAVTMTRADRDEDPQLCIERQPWRGSGDRFTVYEGPLSGLTAMPSERPVPAAAATESVQPLWSGNIVEYFVEEQQGPGSSDFVTRTLRTVWIDGPLDREFVEDAKNVVAIETDTDPKTIVVDVTPLFTYMAALKQAASGLYEQTAIMKQDGDGE